MNMQYILIGDYYIWPFAIFVAARFVTTYALLASFIPNLV